MEHFNRLSQHATALSQTGMGIVGELTKMATSISKFQGEQQKNVIELFKLVTDIQNPTISMDERFKKIHASVDKIHDSYKATQQLVMPPATPVEPPATPVEPPATPVEPPATPLEPPATPLEPPATGGKRRKTRRKTRRNKRNTRKQYLQ